MYHSTCLRMLSYACQCASSLRDSASGILGFLIRLIVYQLSIRPRVCRGAVVVHVHLFGICLELQDGGHSHEAHLREQASQYC